MRWNNNSFFAIDKDKKERDKQLVKKNNERNKLIRKIRSKIKTK